MEQKQLGRDCSCIQDFCVNRANWEMICVPAEKYRIIYKIFLRYDITKIQLCFRSKKPLSRGQGQKVQQILIDLTVSR